jgi:HAD superfamily hydrolase (TIGR01509 family)
MGAHPRAARHLGETYLDHLARRGDRLPGCRPAVLQLRKHYRLGIVTNGIDRVQRSRLAVAGLAPLFEVVVTSQGCGFAKPDPRILHVALDALGACPGQSLYVGDDPATDGGAAAAAGMRFCWVDGGRPVSGRRPRRRVRNLRELPSLLGPELPRTL